MNENPADDFIDILNAIPPAAREKFARIRALDSEALAIEISIDSRRALAEAKASEYAAKKNPKLKAEIEEMLKEINTLHKKTLSISKEKMSLAEAIYNQVDRTTEDLDHYLSEHPVVEDSQMDSMRKTSKSKRGKKQSGWEQDTCEPLYCYCRQISFGVMVMCDSPLCETQWFHADCLNEKPPSDKERWFCRECRKNKGVGRSARGRENGS